MTRLSPRDQACVLHVLDRRKMLREHRVYARFFKDAVASRLDKVRPLTRDFVGLTQMNDDQGKAPNAKMNDPYATPIPTDPIQFVCVTNPLLVKKINEQCDEVTRKKYTKLFKKCIANINRSRPKMVVVAGFVDEQCRKLLARISESIPVVVHDGSAFFTFWMMGVQCIAVQSSNVSEESAQMAWLREHLEQVRMSKHPFFIFCNTDPRDLPAVLLKRLTRGRALCLMGVSKDATSFDAEVSYTCNEATDDDDASIRSDNSEEDDRDSFTMKMQGTQENGLRWITIDEEPDKWDIEFKPVELPPSID
jgi:ribosomal protein L30E